MTKINLLALKKFKILTIQPCGSAATNAKKADD